MGTHRHSWKRIFSIAALSMLGLVGTSSPAQANTVIHDQFTETFEETVTDICSFPVNITGQISAFVEAFKDDQGRILKVNLHFDNTISFSANGNTVIDRQRYNEFDLGFDVSVQPGFIAPTTIVYTGLTAQMNLPGGPVLVEAGRTVEDVATGTVIFQAGRVSTSGDAAAQCAALS
jgi:hypothetical protein